MAYAQGLAIKQRTRSLLYVWSMLAGVVVFLAGSKGPVLAWVLATAVVLFFADAIAWRKILVAAGLIMAMMGFAESLGLPVLPCGTMKQYLCLTHSVASRLAEIQRLPATGVASPEREVAANWFGYGFGASTRVFDADSGQVKIQSGTLNLFLDLYVELGVIGLSLFLVAVGMLLYHFFRLLCAIPPPEGRALFAAASAVAVVLTVKLMVSAETHTEDLAALVIGLSVGSSVSVPQMGHFQAEK